MNSREIKFHEKNKKVPIYFAKWLDDENPLKAKNMLVKLMDKTQCTLSADYVEKYGLRWVTQ